MRLRAIMIVLAACSTPAPQQPIARQHCDDAPLVSLDDLAQRRHDGERIAFEGVPIAAPKQTAMQCGADDPCCNRVDGSYAIVVKDRLHVELIGFACSGNACQWRCAPFGNTPSTPVRFVGSP
jgi:hypothetical protein